MFGKKHLGQLHIPQPYLILPEHKHQFFVEPRRKETSLDCLKTWRLKTLEPCYAPSGPQKVGCPALAILRQPTWPISETSNIPGKETLLVLQDYSPVFDGNIFIWVHIVYVFDAHACSISFIIPGLRCEIWLSWSKTGTSGDLIAPTIFKWKVRCTGLNCFQSQASLGIP